MADVATFRALDLFSGAAGGWSLGLHRAGIETVAACEADPWRRAVYGRNFPGVRLYDDVRTLTGKQVLADVGAVDLVAGSPPCQDASTANSGGRGIDGERTGLFLDFIRIVGELGPRWVVAENVPGLRTRGADRVIAELEALGYTVWPLVVGAVHVGGPHRRKRVWFVAYAREAGRIGGAEAERPERQPWTQPDGGLAADAASVNGQRPRSDFAQSEHQGGAPGDPHGDTLRHQSGRSGRTDGTVAAEPGDDARNPDSAGLEIREGVGSDARQELPPPIRAIGEAWPDWNGGLAGLGQLDDGLPRGVARAALAGFGDAVVPQITEAIGRSILVIDARLREPA